MQKNQIKSDNSVAYHFVSLTQILCRPALGKLERSDRLTLTSARTQHWNYVLGIAPITRMSINGRKMLLLDSILHLRYDLGWPLSHASGNCGVNLLFSCFSCFICDEHENGACRGKAESKAGLSSNYKGEGNYCRQKLHWQSRSSGRKLALLFQTCVWHRWFKLFPGPSLLSLISGDRNGGRGLERPITSNFEAVS